MKHSTQPAAGTDQSPANHPQALAWDHYITPAHAQELREQAAQWRAEQSHSNVGGYVLVLERKVVGWVSDIAAAYGWLAGCIAIPATEAESFFIAVGGDFEAGAKKFVALDIRETARPDTAPLRLDEPTAEEREAALQSFGAAIRQTTTERRAAAELAVPALGRLCEVMAAQTGQSYKVRDLLYSLWNGQPAELLEIVALDWAIRRDLCAVLLAFGHEDREVQFFYDAVKSALVDAGLFAWFLAARREKEAA